MKILEELYYGNISTNEKRVPPDSELSILMDTVCKNDTRIKEMLNEELPYYPLVYKKMGLIGTGTFEASKLPMHNNIYKNIDNWSWTEIVDNSEE